MKTPICDICLKSGILCSGCREKLSSGLITDLDVLVSKQLFLLSGEYNIPRTITFFKAFEEGGAVIVVVNAEDVGSIIGKGGKIIKQLQRNIGQKVRVVAHTTDSKKIAEDLLYPARVTGVNRLYLPSGEIRKKLRIHMRDKKKLPMDLKSVETIIQKMTNESVEIIAE